MPDLTRRTFVLGLSAFATTPASASGVWPQRPIALMHGFAPGGPVDTLSRILAEALSARLGQPVVIEPRPGATGTTVGGMVARAKPDGYTLMAVPATYVATAAMYRTLPYKPIADFSFISSTAEYPFLLVTHPDSPIQNVGEIVNAARSRGTPLQYGTAGVGSLQHLTMELLARETRIPLQHVPYRGGAPATLDLLGKRLDLVLDPPTTLMQFVTGGKLRALAVTSDNRFVGLPDVPTIGETVIPRFAVTGYQGIAAPAGLPDELVQKLNGAIAAVLAEPAVVEKLHKIGNTPRPSSPDGYKARIAADIEQWTALIVDAKIARI
ncbi:MAG: tripartite tricarboxylate transporter substrate binding protein [Pseudolabrys sp.]